MHALWESLKKQDCVVHQIDGPVVYPVLPLYGRAIQVIQSPDLPAIHGSILHSVWSPHDVATARRTGQPLRWSMVQRAHFTDLYWFTRGLLHATERYLGDWRGELVQMTKAEALLCELNGLIVGLRRDNLDALIDNIRHAVAKTLVSFTPRAIIVEKAETRQQLLKIGEVYDTLNRLNPSALLARLVAAHRRVRGRQQHVLDIAGEYTTRRHVAMLATSFLEAQTHVGQDFLDRLLAKWDINMSAHPSVICAQLRESAKLFTTFSIRPFLETFTYVADEYERAATAIEARQYTVAKQLLATAQASFQLRALRSRMERTVLDISRTLHLRKPLRVEPVLQDLAEFQQQLQRIDCSHMRGFSVEVTLAGLQSAAASFQKTVGARQAHHEGYDTFRRVVTTV